MAGVVLGSSDLLHLHLHVRLQILLATEVESPVESLDGVVDSPVISLLRIYLQEFNIKID